MGLELITLIFFLELVVGVAVILMALTNNTSLYALETNTRSFP